MVSYVQVSGLSFKHATQWTKCKSLIHRKNKTAPRVDPRGTPCSEEAKQYNDMGTDYLIMYCIHAINYRSEIDG